MPPPFTTLRSHAIAFDANNVDTDQIIPARYMRTPRKQGYERFLFYDLRFHADGTPNQEFVLNRPENAGAKVIVAGENFGCGSSREAAVYALFDYGIRCVIAPSFGDIFRTNCFKNGLLPLELSKADHAALQTAAAAEEIEVDLPQQTVRRGGRIFSFSIPPFWKECLVSGADDIDLTLRYRDQIAAFSQGRFASFPWLVSAAKSGV